MKFNLTNDLVFFDIEATGLNVIRDRIIQIALVKYPKDGTEPQEMEMLINPGGVLISKEAMEVHGITSEQLKNKPTFDQVAEKIFDFIGDADLAGYNSDRFDIPMLLEEFNRAGFELNMDKRKTVDVQKIFYKMEPRTLKAALKLYCDKEIENAHDALADVKATVEVLQGQLKRYDGVDHEDGDGFITKTPIRNDIAALHDFTSDKKNIDVTRRLKLSDNGEVVFNFGKYNGQPVGKSLASDKQYYHWIQEKDFSFQVKRIVKKELDAYEGKS